MRAAPGVPVISGLLVSFAFFLGCEVQVRAEGEPDRSVAAAGFPTPGPESAAQARARGFSDLVVRRVWGGRGISLDGDVSYDGRFFVYSDWSTGDLALRALRTGETRRLTNKGEWRESQEYAMGPRLSRDGERVAFTWAVPDGNGERYELGTVGIEGGVPRTVYRDASIEWIAPAGWFPDGEHILAYVIRSTGTNQLLEVQAETGDSRILMSTSAGPGSGNIPLDGRMALSPDGRAVLFDRVVEEDPDHGDIFLLDLDQGRETPLVVHPANDLVLGWAPDDRHILFASDRGGTLGAWLLGIEGDEPQGEPVLVRPDLWRMTPIGFAEDGSYFFGISTTMRNVFVAPLDEDWSALSGPLQAVGQPHVDLLRNTNASWSPAGRFLAYQSLRGTLPSARYVIVIWSAETGQAREVKPRDVGFVAPRLWAEDGRHILGYGRDEGDRWGFFSVDVGTGATEAFENFWGVSMAAPMGLSSDGRSLFYKVWLEDGAGIEVREFDGGAGRLLYKWERQDPDMGFFEHGALSPDGTTLALGAVVEGHGVIQILPSSGGSPRVLMEFPAGTGPDQITWAPDGQAVICRSDLGILAVPVDGTEPRKLNWEIDEGLVQAMRTLRFTPDGTRISFSAEAGEEELWVMENFLPGN
jgi:Tol biopolymer transport system component